MKVKLKNLIIDPDLLVRTKLDTHTQARYSSAMRQGDVFPPLVIDKMKRIICGWHRYMAYCDVYDDSHAVDCIVSKNSSYMDLLVEAFRDNQKNGIPMSTTDTEFILERFVKTGMSKEEASAILGISVKRITTLGRRQAVVVGKDGSMYTAPLKPGHEHMIDNGPVSEKDYQDHINHDLGATPRFHMQKIIDILKRENWMPADEKTYATAQVLHAELTKYLDINMKGAVYETTKRAS